VAATPLLRPRGSLVCDVEQGFRCPESDYEVTLRAVVSLSAIEKTRGYGGYRSCIEFVIGRSAWYLWADIPLSF
jgi:hypothetical protein